MITSLPKFSIQNFNEIVFKELEKKLNPQLWSKNLDLNQKLISGSLSHHIKSDLVLRFDSGLYEDSHSVQFLSRIESDTLKNVFSFTEWLMSGKSVAEFVMFHLAELLVKRKTAVIYLHFNIFDPIGIQPLEILRLFEILYRRAEVVALFILDSSHSESQSETLITQLILQRTNSQF